MIHVAEKSSVIKQQSVGKDMLPAGDSSWQRRILIYGQVSGKTRVK